MNKHKRQQKYRVRVHKVSLPQVGFVTLPASRESEEPFCSWYGPRGETCSSLKGLTVVATLPGRPPCAYMACPAHYNKVRENIERFLARLGTSLSEVDETKR